MLSHLLYHFCKTVNNICQLNAINHKWCASKQLGIIIPAFINPSIIYFIFFLPNYKLNKMAFRERLIFLAFPQKKKVKTDENGMQGKRWWGWSPFVTFPQNKFKVYENSVERFLNFKCLLSGIMKFMVCLHANRCWTARHWFQKSIGRGGLAG